MSLHSDLLAQAQHLAKMDSRKPKQASLRRSVSAAYYALFHLLTSEASGAFASSDGLLALIKRCYSHTDMMKVSKSVAAGQLPTKLSGVTQIHPDLRSVAQTFIDLQQARHDADYDVDRSFSRSESLALIGRVERAFQDWMKIRTQDCSRLYLGGFLLWDTWEKKLR